jgi:adenine-specific DNA-methyltransferase
MFEHYDDWMEHSTWLSFMRDRLLLIKELLAPDGTVWVHLDDAEQHRMRCLMDEIFGASNFVTSVVWEKADTVRNDARRFSSSHDILHVYARDRALWFTNRLPRSDENNVVYRNPDSDSRGAWLPVPLQAPGIRPNSTFEVVSPTTGRRHLPPAGKCWRRQPDELATLIEDNRVYFGKDGMGVPQLKKFLTDAGDLVPDTVWSVKEVGGNRQSKAEIKALLDTPIPFDTPKPEKLMERILHISTVADDLVVDCFGGSGTTAAVALKMGRRFVTAEIVPSTIEAFLRPRLEKVVLGSDQGGVSKSRGWTGGSGFREVNVAASMYNVATDGTVLLSEVATNGAFARAMAGQLDFDFQPAGTPFCGRRGRMRLAVFDGAVGREEVRNVVPALGDEDRVTIVAQVVLPGAEEMLASLSEGSRIRKAPRDVLADGSRRARRRETAR